MKQISRPALVHRSTASRARGVGVIAASCLGWTLFGVPAPADAQATEDDRLEWHAPADCPTRAEVLARLQTELAARDRSAAWRATARIARVRSGYSLELTLQVSNAPAAARRLEAANCPTLANAVAVLIALALEPPAAASEAAAPAAEGGEEPRPRAPASSRTGTVEGRSPAVDPPPPAAGARAVEPAPAAEAAETPAASEPSPPFGFFAGAALRFDLGMLPQRPGFGLQGRIGIHWADWRARLGFTGWLPGAATPESYPSARVRGRALLADAGISLAVTPAPLRVSPGVVVEVGALALEVTRISNPNPRSLVWSAAGASIRAEYGWPLGLELFVEAAGLLPLSRPRSLLQSPAAEAEVFTVAAFLLRFSAGVTYAFELR